MPRAWSLNAEPLRLRVNPAESVQAKAQRREDAGVGIAACASPTAARGVALKDAQGA